MRKTIPLVKHLVSLVSLCVFATGLLAQNLLVQNNDIFLTYRMEEMLKGQNYYAHSADRPFLQRDLMRYGKDSTIIAFEKDTVKAIGRFSRGHLLDVKKKWFGFKLDPSVHYEAGYSSKAGFAGDFQTGLRMQFDLGKMVTVFGDARYGAMKPLSYVEEHITRNNVMPSGDFAYKGAGGFHNYWDLRGYVSIAPTKAFNVQAGYDKMFFGNGHRSLLLSDNADKFLFLRLNTRFWRIKYTNVFANFRDISGANGSRGAGKNKFGTFHNLSLNIGNRFNISLFEGIIWQGSDSTGSRGFEPNYLNPIILYRPVEFSLNSPDNAVVGFDMRYRIGKNNHLYGQIVIDEFLLQEVISGIKKALNKDDESIKVGFWGNKQGFQVGLKGYDMFGLDGLFYLFEFNYVRPFTYTHVTIEQNYGHKNEELAHPLGANFIESVNILRYRKGNWLAELMVNYSKAGRDTSARSFGGDIFKSYLLRQGEYGHAMTQGNEVNTIYTRAEVSYVLNATMNFRIFGGVSYRNEWSEIDSGSEFYGFFGVSTSLYKQRVDY